MFDKFPWRGIANNGSAVRNCSGGYAHPAIFWMKFFSKRGVVAHKRKSARGQKMGKKMSGRGVSRDARVACRLPLEEKERLQAECEAHGVSLSELLRARAIGTKLLSQIEAQAIAELRRQGGLLKHLVTQSDAVDPKQVRDAVATIVATVKRIGDQAAAR